MKVVVPWPLADQQHEALPDGVELAEWLGGDPPADALDAAFVAAPYSAGEPGRLARFADLKVVQTQSAGIDWIVDAVPHGVTLCDARGVHDVSVSEWVLTVVLACVRDIPLFVRWQEQSHWERRDTVELHGRRALILGYGSIGAAVEARLQPFGVDITRVARTAREGVHGFQELSTLLPSADIVIVLVPLTDQTRDLVDSAFLAALPDGALVVNAARGAVVDEQALAAELATGRISAALDVTVQEPLPADDLLWQAPGLLLTPHVGGDTTALYPRLHRLVREQVERFVSGEPLANVVENGY
jgi:phosphoglycerate dehydrogenase-like enzyme